MGAIHPESRSFGAETPPESEPSGPRLLDRLERSGLVERGCVTVIGLDAVRDRLGERWAHRREHVWNAVEQHLSRRLRPEDFHARIGETEHILAIPGGTEHAQAVSLNLLKELLTFFLGEQTLEDLKIYRVTSIDQDLMARAPVDPASVMQDQGAAREADLFSFTAADGRELQLTYELEPVISLARFAPAAVRLRPALWEPRTGGRLPSNWRQSFAFADVLNVDLHSLEAARQLYRTGQMVVVPCSIETLFSTRGRAGVVSRLSADIGAVKTSLVTEIIGIDAGTPGAQLAESVAVLKRQCRAVIARVAEKRAGLDLLGESQLAGLSTDGSGWPEEERELLSRLGRFSKAARPVARLMFAFGLPSVRACRLAASVGATHASVRQAFEPSIRAA